MRNRRNKRSKVNLIKENSKTIIICLSLTIGIIFISLIFSIINLANDKILNGISINNIDISNLTQEQASEKIKDWYNEVVLKNINLRYEDMEESINIAEFEPKENIDKTIEKAMEIGRDGNIITNNYTILATLIFHKNIDLQIDLNEEKFNNKIIEISGKLPGAIVQSSYYIDGENLIIKKGTDGITTKDDELKKKIEESMVSTQKDIQIPVKNETIEEIDIEKIHDEIYKEAKNAYVEENPTKVYSHVEGIDFAISIEEAKQILEEEKEEYIIPLKISMPEVTIADIAEKAFPEKLSSFTTRYDASNENRSTNISLAAEKIDGTVVLPGETFSYNKTVGERTISEGYKEATVYSGGKIVQGIGGGICQLSTTLYNAVLYANLEVTKRSNHRFLISYADPGRDATISWGTVDFCFENSRQYPIKISCIVQNGLLRIDIYGLKEEEEYDVKLETNILEETEFKTNYIDDPNYYEGTEYIQQYGSKGLKCETYRILSQNGKVVSKDLLSIDTYSSLEQIVRKGTKEVEEVSTQTEEITQNNNQNQTDEKSALYSIVVNDGYIIWND